MLPTSQVVLAPSTLRTKAAAIALAGFATLLLEQAGATQALAVAGALAFFAVSATIAFAHLTPLVFESAGAAQALTTAPAPKLHWLHKVSHDTSLADDTAGRAGQHGRNAC
jgi:hypothetical protein